MNVLNVCCNFDAVTGGGEAERTLQMSKALIASGIGCRILTTDTGLTGERKNVIGFAGVIALPLLLRRFYLPSGGFKQIRQLVSDADIVHLIGHWTILNALVYYAVRREHKPYVVCPAGAATIFGRSKLLKKFYSFVVGRRIFENAANCIAVTEDEREHLVHAGALRDRVVVIQNAVVHSDFDFSTLNLFRKKFQLSERRFILFVGRLNPIKGPDLLLEAFHMLRDEISDVDLVFVGPDGGLQKQLELDVHSLNLGSRVHFMGYLGGADKSAAYHAADLLVIPSRLEAMSIVALEAGICGTPVLLTDKCGFHQLADVGGGWVVPATAVGIKVGISNVMDDSEARILASINIKKYVGEQYTWTVAVERHIGLFRSALAKLS